VSPKINALATIFVAMILVGSVIVWWSLQRWARSSAARDPS